MIKDFNSRGQLDMVFLLFSELRRQGLRYEPRVFQYMLSVYHHRGMNQDAIFLGEQWVGKVPLKAMEILVDVHLRTGDLKRAYYCLKVYLNTSDIESDTPTYIYYRLAMAGTIDGNTEIALEMYDMYKEGKVDWTISKNVLLAETLYNLLASAGHARALEIKTQINININT
jgi:hypothetical protein